MESDLASVSVVLVGTFAPRDFLPKKLLDVEAISPSDALAAEISLLVPDQVLEFHLPWCKVNVLRERLSIEATQIPYVRACDLAIKLTREVSPRSLVSKLGINYTAHFRVESRGRDEIGRRLVPPEEWGSWGKEVADSTRLPVTDPKHGGMMIAVLRESSPQGRDAGWIDVRVEPSARIANGLGVFISVNDHYETRPPVPSSPTTVTKDMSTDATEKMLGYLETGFDASVQRSLEICNGILTGT